MPRAFDRAHAGPPPSHIPEESARRPPRAAAPARSFLDAVKNQAPVRELPCAVFALDRVGVDPRVSHVRKRARVAVIAEQVAPSADSLVVYFFEMHAAVPVPAIEVRA